MASGGEAVTENASYYQKLVFFSTSLWCDLWTQITTVCCVSYIAVATIRIELSEHKVFDKRKEKKKEKDKKQFVILLLVSFITYKHAMHNTLNVVAILSAVPNKNKNNAQFCYSPVSYLSDAFSTCWRSKFLRQ